MKRTALAALMVYFAMSSVSADNRSNTLKMTASGTMLATTINLQNDTITDEEELAGDGSLGAFTFHGLRADVLTPQSPEPPLSCETPVFIPVVNGAGVFRFDDGSLLVVNITGGGICINPAAGMAQLTETYEIARGTGRFKHASGTLTLTVSVVPVLFNAAGAPQFLTMSGRFEADIAGIAHNRND